MAEEKDRGTPRKAGARKQTAAARKRTVAARKQAPSASKGPSGKRTAQAGSAKKASATGKGTSGQPKQAAGPKSRARGDRPALDDPQEMLTTGALMAAASVVRVGVACLELWSERLPALIELDEKVRDTRSPAGPEQGQLRDELLAMARSSSEIVLHELRRGLEDLDVFTRPDEPPAPQGKRPYRAKP